MNINNRLPLYTVFIFFCNYLYASSKIPPLIIFLIAGCLSNTNGIESINISDNVYKFKISDTKTLAEEWGKKKNNTNMKYEKLARSMRYYYPSGILSHNKQRLTFTIDLNNRDEIINSTSLPIQKNLSSCLETSNRTEKTTNNNHPKEKCEPRKNTKRRFDIVNDLVDSKPNESKCKRPSGKPEVDEGLLAPEPNKEEITWTSKNFTWRRQKLPTPSWISDQNKN